MWKAAALCRRRASDSAPSPVGRGRSWRQFLPCSGNHITGEAARYRGTELAPRFAVRILHVGNVHLVDPLRAHGHEVIAAFEEYPALAVPGVPFDVRALWRRLPFAPDLLLVADTLGPQALPFGLETVGESVEKRLSWEEMGALFASSKIVLNESILGDLNFRVFEAMACGALLLTERIENGLVDLFAPGEELAVYGPDDLVAQVEQHLGDDAARTRIAARGAALVRERHTLGVRMGELAAVVEAGIARRDTGADVALAWGMTAHLASVRGLATPAVTVPAAAMSLRAAADAGNAEAALGLAEILVWAGQDDAALATLAEARERDPGLLRAWLVAAEVERRRGHTAAAADLLGGGIQDAPAVTDATRELALAAVDRGLEDAGCSYALGLVLQEHGVPFTPGLVCQLDAGLPRTALDYFSAAVRAGSRRAAEQTARLFELVGLPNLAVLFDETAVGLALDAVAPRDDLSRTLRKSYRYAEAAHQARVARVLGGEDVGDATSAEREAASRDAERALGDAALARLDAKDVEGAR